MSSSTRRVVLAAALSLFAYACAGAGQQRVTMPAEGSAIAADRCRVYIAREDVLSGSARNVRIFDGETEVGTLSEGQYLCWDRPAARAVGRAVFEGISRTTRAVENVFDLPREAGTTTWFAIRIPHAGQQPVIESLPAEDGRALISKRRPAAAP